jgi:hypothetical protein
MMVTGLWFGTCFSFSYVGSNHPNCLPYFSEGLKPPTRLAFGILMDNMVYPYLVIRNQY